MTDKENLHMPGEMCMAELVYASVTGADLDYIGSITISPEAIVASGLLPGQMVYIDNTTRRSPSWRTYIVQGQPGKGEVIMNGPPAHHFKKGDRVNIRGSALVSSIDMPAMGKDHTRVYFTQDGDTPNQVLRVERADIPQNHWRHMCISKLHRIMVTDTAVDKPEALVVDEEILEAAGFPPGEQVQFTSLKDGALRRTTVKAGHRGTGMAEVHGSGALHISAGTRLVSLAEVWLPYADAVSIGGPQVVFFDEKRNDRNVVRDVKPRWHPSSQQ